MGVVYKLHEGVMRMFYTYHFTPFKGEKPTTFGWLAQHHGNQEWEVDGDEHVVRVFK